MYIIYTSKKVSSFTRVTKNGVLVQRAMSLPRATPSSSLPTRNICLALV